MDYFLIRAVDLRDGASTEFLGDLIEGLDLGLGLNIVEGVAVCRIADTITINGERAVSRSGGYVDVAVVVVIVG